MNMLVPNSIVGVPLLTWYAFKVAPRREFAARTSLALRGITAFVPTELKKIRPQRERRRRVLIELPLIPGYCFLGFELGDTWKWDALSRMRDVVYGVVAFGGKAAEIDHDSIAHLMSISGQELVKEPKPQKFKAGDSVRVSSGPLEGQQARIESMKKVRAIIDLLTTGRHIDVPLSALELA